MSEYSDDRRRAREITLQALYYLDVGKATCKEIQSLQWVEGSINDATREYAFALIQGTCLHLDEIDAIIRRQSKHWDITRITAVDRAILRFSIFSLTYQQNIPKKVIINEAIEIAKHYSTKKSFQFINGVLDGITLPTNHN